MINPTLRQKGFEAICVTTASCAGFYVMAALSESIPLALGAAGFCAVLFISLAD